MRSLLLTAVAAAALLPLAAQAASLDNLKYQAVSDGGLIPYQAAPNVVGQTSTGTVASGGNPIYLATAPKYSGVVALIMDEGAAGKFICSGALLSDHQSILTAGHCVSHGAGTATPLTTTAYFNPTGTDIVVPQNPVSVAVGVSQYFVHPDYTGEVIDDNDIAVLRLSAPAPLFAQSYDLFTGNAVGQDYNVAGYGLRSNVGGAVGATPNATGTGRLRQGDNRFDFTLGDASFGGFFDGGPAGFFGTAENTHTLIADFDDGLAANDGSCQLAGAFGLGGAQFCNTGLGALEVSVAGGDSGGPQFINGMIASVTSFGLTFGTDFGDVDNKLDDSFGEFNGFTPVGTHISFIHGAMGIPEPSAWALMIMGFGLTGTATRRNRRRAVAA